MVCAQTSQPDSGNAPAAAAPVVTIHGVVKNAATGQPLPRVLVKVEGQTSAGALTDGDGAFEIPGLPAGESSIDLTKPGYEDASAGGGEAFPWMLGSPVPHAVNLTAEMPALEFAMRPLNAIRGQIQLSTGEPAEGFRVELFKRSIQDGRQRWRIVANAQTNADGAFRFGALSDGTYTVAVQPSIDGDGGRIFQLGSSSPRVRTGYARLYYPDARDLSGAGLIGVSAGETAQANLTLRQERFHLVQAAVSAPGLESASEGALSQTGVAIAIKGTGTTFGMIGLEPEVLDTRGHALQYRVEYDAKARLMQAMLPDGDYTLRAIAFGPSKPSVNRTGGIVTEVKNFLSGQTDVSVNGRAVTNLRIALGPEATNAIDVRVNRTAAAPPQQADGSEPTISINAAQAGADFANPFPSEFAQGSVPGTLETQPLGPGSYWLQTTTETAGLCESSFTAGGANLAREPLVVAANGSTASLTLTLRDDCASLRVSLPQRLAAIATGETPNFEVYIIPDFDSTEQVRPHTLFANLENSFVEKYLTPGAYHVYASRGRADLPYRDPVAMAALNLQGQAVTLTPGATTDLVLEVPAP